MKYASGPRATSALQEVARIQDGRCGICGGEPSRLELDHCHRSGEIRGALCRSCNVRLANYERHRIERPDCVHEMDAFDAYLADPPAASVDLPMQRPRAKAPLVVVQLRTSPEFLAHLAGLARETGATRSTVARAMIDVATQHDREVRAKLAATKGVG